MTIEISQHAISRFAERVLGFNFPEDFTDTKNVSRLDSEVVGYINANILTDDMVKKINYFRSGKFPQHGWFVVAEDSKIVTIEV